MNANYTITTIITQGAGGINTIIKGETKMTLAEARNKVQENCDKLRKRGINPHDCDFVVLRNGKIAFPHNFQSLKKVTNIATGKTLWDEVQGK